MDVKIYKVKSFQKWAKKQLIKDDLLLKAIYEIKSGLFDAKIGSFLYKKRIAFKGKGKRGSARTILAYKEGNKVIFLYGFAKNERDNITKKEQEALNEYAKMYMALSAAAIKKVVNLGELIEVVKNGQQDIKHNS